MSDPRPVCPTCNKTDLVVDNDTKKVTAPRHWYCLRCSTPIRKPRL